MVDIAFGPEPGRRPDLTNPTNAYIHHTRRKRMYGGILLVLFIAMMAAGFQTAEHRTAGGFFSGLGQMDDFPREVLSEAWTNRASLPGLFIQYMPSLLVTIDIAAVSTLMGGGCSARYLPCLPPAIWPAGRA